MIILVNSSFKYLVYLRYLRKKLNLTKFWDLHNGDWHWLKEKAVSIASINPTLWRLSVPSFSFHFMLGLSALKESANQLT